ncbi:MAG: PBP1A family penicillin-binding protein [Deltaproteobacteria bacterium]|nr:PBP1A family penicillin-binding protein [Deltaproteobacteria bacterium]
MAALVVLVGGFGVGFLVGGRLVQLDRVVVGRFEGQRFRVPSRVLSAPTILYPGVDIERIGLRNLLDRLGYRSEVQRGRLDLGRLAIGHQAWAKGGARVHLRGFDHPTRPERPRDVLLRLDGKVVREIRELPEGRPLGAVLLEPEPVGSYYGPDREQRDLVQLADVPQHLVDAILAVEDQRFQSHHGVDVRRIVGAAIANVKAGSIRQGGSTLTQQLAKNFFLSHDRTLRRKLDEAAMAMIMEARYAKDEILEAYLNEIYLGQRGATAVHGVGEAARYYFGKPVRHLRAAESALLAAIIQSPNATSPFRHEEKAVERRNLVLALMHDQGRLDAASYREAREDPLVLAARTQEIRGARYFLDALRRQLPEVYGPDTLTSEGLRIYSTLDFRLQQAATDALVSGLEDLEKRHPRLRRDDPARRLQGCLIALRPQTGEILALVGGRSYGVSQFDRCTQARRPAGSAFKPFVYVAALEPRAGGPHITLASVLDDSPLRVDLPTGPWEPENFDHKFHGMVSVREAMERSLNVATARLAQDVGIGRVADTARRLGVESPLPAVPSLALGAADVSPLEMARAYATLAGGGVRPEIRTFEDLVDANGNTVARRDIGFRRVIDGGTAWLTVSLLEGVVERGTAYGVRRSGLQGPVAGKTGTSDDERDAWFVGFTPELVVAVWVGFDEPQSLGISSSRVAVPIWTRFVVEATGGSVRGSFLPPPEIRELDIEPDTGALALSGCPVARREYFLIGTEPTHTCPPGRDSGFELEREADRLRDAFMKWLDDVMN